MVGGAFAADYAVPPRSQGHGYASYPRGNAAPTAAVPPSPTGAPGGALRGRTEVAHPAAPYAVDGLLYGRPGAERRADPGYDRARVDALRHAYSGRATSPDRADCGGLRATPPGAAAEAHYRGSPVRRRSPAKPHRRDSRSISPTGHGLYRGAAAPPLDPPLHSAPAADESLAVDATPLAAADDSQQQADTQRHQVDLLAWKERLDQMTRDELKALILENYDQARSGSIDFCDFLALWFRGRVFQIRRSCAEEEDSVEPPRESLEVQGKHLYRIREVFNEYEETYLGGVRYGLIAAVLKDLQYDADQEISHVYGLCTEDMVSLIDELATHRQRLGGLREPRFDFAYVLQLILKYITDTEEIALFYDSGCKVFQAMRTKEYGEQPIYQNSTVSTKLLVSVLGAVARRPLGATMP
eukprot:TRINITY_DN10085_c0_g1_i1.p1 TRINITY_DN10085_c0_g1~~TRINITY_DN10085_c0_g1_i1.p1  ORF type:complete len:434 (+),score=129.72 TRINITY_DN10085_c0_g1_i1:66-1304(+)